MTGTGWFFMVACWTTLTVLTVWCFVKILGPQQKTQ